MNEKEFIKALEAMAQANLCKPVSADTAKRYAAKLGIKSDLTKQLQAEGYLPPGQCVLDLMEADPKTLSAIEVWKDSRKLDDKALRALNLMLQLYFSARKESRPAVRNAVTMKQPAMKQVAADKTMEPPLSLYGLLSGLQKATINCRENVRKKPYVLLMEALLLEEGFIWSSDTTDTDLRIWGSRYGEHAEKILANLRDPQIRSQVCSTMEDALLELVDFDLQEILQRCIANTCVTIEEAMEDWYMQHLKVASDYPKSQARLLLYQLASMKNGAGEELYRDIPMAQLTEKVVSLFELALLAAKGEYPLLDNPQTLQSNLNAEELDLLSVIGCGIPVKRTFIKDDAVRMALLPFMEKGLLRVKEGGLALAPDLKSLPLTRLSDGCGGLKNTPAAQLLLQILKKRTAADADADLRAVLLRHLENLAEKLEEGQECSLILAFLIDWYWENSNHHLAESAIPSAEKLIALLHKYPDEVRHRLGRKLGNNYSDLQLHLAMRNGSTLLEAELYGLCAGRCLDLAMSEEKKDKGGYWACSAVNMAKKALQKLELTPEPFLELRNWLILAMGYALQAAEEAGRPGKKWPYSAETLTADYILPCLEVLEEAEQLLNFLEDGRRNAAEELYAAMAGACHLQISEEDSPLYRCLEKAADDFAADCEAGRWFDSEWVKTKGLEKTGGCRELMEVILRHDRPAKLFLPWYCNTFDSTLACGPACSQELTEASLLNILLSGQKVTLSANQLVDNECMWNLTQVPAFLWLMRNGYITVSMFGSLKNLMEYTVTRMENPNFYWSSLPDEFMNRNLRSRAAEYLKGEITAAELPGEHRQILIKMKDAVRLMDENLPAVWCSYYHQADEELTGKRGIGPLVPLPKRVADYYSVNREMKHYNIMKELNSILTRANPNLDRSVYRRMIWAIEAEDAAALSQLGVDVAALDKAGLGADFLAAERADMMKDMIRIVDDCQNRMLGERISTHQYYVYDEAAARIVPEWHAGPVHDTGKLSYRQMEKKVEEDGFLLGWGQVPQRLMDLERLAEENPKADAERLCSRLSNMGLSDYGIFGLDSSLRLKELAFRASSGKAAGRKYSEEEKEGELFQVEKDLNGEPKK